MLFESCSECDTNTCLTKCHECGFAACDKCFQKHDSTLCELLQKHTSTLSDLCKIHSGQKLVSFCTVCNVLLCDKCHSERNHQRHKKGFREIFGAMGLVKHHDLPKLISEYKNKQSQADTYIERYPEKCRLRETKTKLDLPMASSSDEKKKILKQADQYKKYIDERCSQVEHFKNLLNVAIEGLHKIKDLSNPYTFFPILNGIRSEVLLVDKETNTDDDNEEYDFEELFGFIRPMDKQNKEHTGQRAASNHPTRRKLPGVKQEGDNTVLSHLKNDLTKEADSSMKGDEGYSVILGVANQFRLDASKLIKMKKFISDVPVTDVKSFKDMTERTLAFFTKSIDSKSNEIKYLESELQKEKNANNRLEDEIEKCQDKIDELQSLLDESRRKDESALRTVEIQTERENDKLRTDGIDKLQKLNMELREQLQVQRTEIMNSKDKIKELESHIQAVDEDRCKHELDVRSIEIQTERENDKQITDEIEKLKRLNMEFEEQLLVQKTDLANREKEFHEQHSISETTINELKHKLVVYENKRQVGNENVQSVDVHTQSENDDGKIDEMLLEIKRLRNFNVELENKLAVQATDIKNRARDLNQLFNEKENEIEAKDRDLKEKAAQLQDLHSRVQSLSDQLRNSELKINEIQKQSQTERNTAQARQGDLQRQLHHARANVEEQLKEKQKLETSIKTLKSEKDELQTRLSSFAGEKLTKGNPSITDLGDPNRPMKIGEKFSELYDNDWTDAMEKVDEIKSFFPDSDSTNREEILIRHLLRILRCCYQGCFRMATEKVKEVVDVIFRMDTCGEQSNKTNNIADHLNGIYGLLQRGATTFLKDLVQSKAFCDSMLNDWDYPLKNEEVMKMLTSTTYYQKCVQLCWYMVIQNPAMCLDKDIQPGTPMDKNMYREFTKSGEKVAFVVWPALFLHENGPLLNKGVVQLL